MLNEKQINAIEYLLAGTMLKSEIAERVGISTRTLSRWENDEEFKAELDRWRNQLKKTAEDKITVQVTNLVDKMIKLANSSSDQRVRYNAIKYLLDRSLGTPVVAKEENKTNTNDKDKDTNTLKAELEDIKNLKVVK